MPKEDDPTRLGETREIDSIASHATKGRARDSMLPNNSHTAQVYHIVIVEGILTHT